MGYRIDYDEGTKRFEVTQDRPWRLWLLTGGFFVLFYFLSSWFWPEGNVVMRDMLIPGDDAVTVQAIANLTDNLRTGTSFKEAVVAFCREILIGTSVLY